VTSALYKYRNGLIYDPLGNFPIGMQTPNGDMFNTLVLGRSNIPVILAPNGTVAANGQITLGTALGYIPANCWLFLPAGAITGGAAGLYFAQMSSTTVGQVYATFVPSGAPFAAYVPGASQLTAAVGSGSAYTQTTGSDFVMASVTVPGGLIGPSGALRAYGAFTFNNSAGAKTFKSNFGTSALVNGAPTTSQQADFLKLVRNRAINLQAILATSGSGYGATSNNNALTLGTDDTTTDKVFNITTRLAVATDWIALEGFDLEVMPGA